MPSINRITVVLILRVYSTRWELVQRIRFIQLIRVLLTNINITSRKEMIRIEG